MYLPDGLRRFVRAHRDEPTLSAYVETAPADPAARRIWRVLRRQRINDLRDALGSAPADESDAFERCATEVIARLPHGDALPTITGWACFASASGETLEVILPEPVETTVRWGPGVRANSADWRTSRPTRRTTSVRTWGTRHRLASTVAQRTRARGCSIASERCAGAERGRGPARRRRRRHHRRAAVPAALALLTGNYHRQNTMSSRFFTGSSRSS